MVNSATSLTSSGLRDWLVQRITAVIIGAYGIFLLIFMLLHWHLHYAEWHALFAHPLMRLFSVLALLSIAAHAWVGMWTIFTDYVKATFIRLILQTVMVIALFGYIVWGIDILWGL